VLLKATMSDLEKGGGEPNETTPLDIDNDDDQISQKAVTPKELCTRIMMSFKDPIFLVLLGFLYFLVFSFGPHEINGYDKAHANLYRRVADFLHLLSFFVMLVKLWRQKSGAGLSLKTQYLLLIVFVSRYTDLFYQFISTYNTLMKILYIGLTTFIILTLKFREPWKASCAKTEDDFKIVQYALAPCMILAVIYAETHPGHTVREQIMEVLWEFSIYVEAIAIIPQILVLRRTGEVDRFMMLYLLLRGSYRALYIVNWIEREKNEKWYRIDYSAFIAAVIQTLPFVFFFATLRKTSK
jgi:ER lumen protein retaining receptor